MTASSDEIDNLLNANKENLPLPKEESMTGNLLNVDKENLPIFPASLRRQ